MLDEAGAGDAEASRERLMAIQDFPILDLTEEVGDLAAAPREFPHLACERRHRRRSHRHCGGARDGVSAHLELHAHRQRRNAVAIETVCRERGFSCPVICTPEALMGVNL